MATIDVYNLSGAKAGTLELADEVFGAVNEDLLWEAITHYRAAARAESSGSRRARAARVSVPSGRRSGATAARYTDRSRDRMTTLFRRKNFSALFVQRWLQSLPMAS